jgi:hypothetical protein
MISRQIENHPVPLQGIVGIVPTTVSYLIGQMCRLYSVIGGWAQAHHAPHPSSPHSFDFITFGEHIVGSDVYSTITLKLFMQGKVVKMFNKV